MSICGLHLHSYEDELQPELSKVILKSWRTSTSPRQEVYPVCGSIKKATRVVLRRLRRLARVRNSDGRECTTLMDLSIIEVDITLFVHLEGDAAICPNRNIGLLRERTT